MDYFLKNYKHHFKEALAQYGFKTYNKAFYRIKNDVMQYFLLHRWVPYGRSCTIDFDIYPLCMGVDKSYFVSATFDVTTLKGLNNWWEYDPKSEKSISDVTKKMLTATIDHLIPFFERAVDCRSAYNEICKLQKKLYGQIVMHDYSMVYFNIKIGCFNKAIEHLKAIEDQINEDDSDTLSRLGPEDKKEYIAKKNKSLWEIREFIKVISLPDINYINQLVAKNEESSSVNLGHKKGIAR